jgi:hypothetical protein
MKIIKNKGKEPVIYIRYSEEKILYIGETDDQRKGRPFRDEPRIGDWDYVRSLKAPSDSKRRKYWEAYLICKLKPANQKTNNYYTLIKKQNGDTNLVEKNLKTEVTPETLDKLRKKNNKERLSYWLNQFEYATIAREDSRKMAMHFYTCYKLENKNINEEK